MHPARLAALALIPLIAYLAWRTTTMMLPWQRHVSTVCRAAIFLFLVLALVRPVNRGESARKWVVFVRDVSLSVADDSDKAEEFINAAQAQQAEHEVRHLSFAGQPGKAMLDSNVAPEELESLDPRKSDPAAALLLAAGLLPPDQVGQIVLLTDGRETRGELFSVAQGIGVPVDVVPLTPFESPEVSVARIAAPPHARPLVPFEIEAVVVSNRETAAEVRLMREGDDVDRREEQLQVGENRVRFRASIAGSSSTVFSVTVTAADDTLPENNRRRAVVMADAPPRVLCVASNPAAAQALREGLSQSGFETAPVRTSNQVPWDDRTLGGLDLIVLHDVPPSSISASAARALQNYVRGGGGLIAVGGKPTFAEDVFGGSPLEPLMPIKALKRREERRPVLALVLVVDKSLSMAKENRMTLAKEAAKKTVGVLTDEDKVGVIAFGNDASWISDLARLTNRGEVLRRIDGLVPKGTTNMYPALEKAYVALEQEDADRRAMIVLTDGVPTPGDYDVLARAMRDARIRVSTVTVSEGADQTIMRDIAEQAGGEPYHCDDPNEVPRILEREARRATAPQTAVAFRPFSLRKLPGLDVSSAPPLTGYAATSPKPHSEVLLVTAEGDPLLSWWRYGQGIAVAATSAGVVGEGWSKWNGYESFWAQLARHAVRPDDPSNIGVYLHETDRGLSVVVDALTTDGGFVDRATVDVRLTNENGGREEFPLPQVAPGRYVRKGDAALFSSDDIESRDIPDEKRAASPFLITVTADGEVPYETRRGWCRDYAAEFRLHPDGVNHPLLKAVARATGGSYDPKPEEIFADDGRRVDRVEELWTYLLMAALVLFVIDVVLRRMRFGPKESDGS